MSDQDQDRKPEVEASLAAQQHAADAMDVDRESLSYGRILSLHPLFASILGLSCWRFSLEETEISPDLV